jgi:hypothetical protein
MFNITTLSSASPLTIIRVSKHSDADGDLFKPSISRLYFKNKTMDKAWSVPEIMKNDFDKQQQMSF